MTTCNERGTAHAKRHGTDPSVFVLRVAIPRSRGGGMVVLQPMFVVGGEWVRPSRRTTDSSGLTGEV